MAYLLQGVDDNGDPVQVSVDTCWRCGLLVNLMLVTMQEHVDRAHPLPPPPAPRHSLPDAP